MASPPAMRFVAWNCVHAFRRKTGHLLRLSPDIAVISEARKECLDALDGSSTSTVWAGDQRAKGLAIVGFNGWRIASCETLRAEQWFLPTIAQRGATKVQIVGVWVKPAKGYVAPTLRALQTLQGFIAGAPTIVAGDFNQSVRFDRRRGPGWRGCRYLEYHGSQQRMALSSSRGARSRNGRYALLDLTGKQALPHRLCVRSRMAR
jgi:hypothetical protein